ncbi:MAG: DUF3800 domain-containing protein [Rubrobacteraceae bacterium]
MADFTHSFYIDDSGTKEYAKNAKEYGRGKSRYFVFGGVLLSIAEAGLLSSEIIKLKLKHFGAEDVEIKSNWLRLPEERSKRYLRPYDISSEELDEFVDKYYKAVVDADLLLIASVVDKVHMQETYSNPWYAPAVAYEILLQRMERQMRNKGIVTVSIDDMTGATPKGNQYKENLKKHHEQLKKTGSKLLSNIDFECVKGRLKFINSSHSHLIQVADIAAYNVYRQFTDHGEKWEEHGLKTLPTYDHFVRLAQKFRAGPGKRVQGYGVVKFPLKNRVLWAVTDE